MNAKRCAGYVWVYLLLTACQGEMDARTYDGSREPGVTPDPQEVVRPALPGDPQDPERWVLPDVAFSTSVGVRKLTRHEYQRSIESLTGIELEPSQIPGELAIGGHTQIAAAQKIGYDDSTRYLELSLQVAERAAPTLFAESGCGEQDAPCVEAWATTLMRQVFRGSPAAETSARYLAVLNDEQAGVTPAARRETWLGMLLTSPYFLYRQERGERVDEQGRRALTSLEVASRMSYLLWQSEPDAELLDVAESGDLRDESTRHIQLARMLADPRAKFGLRAFVQDWMAVLDPEVVGSKDARILDGTDATLPERVHTSLGRTIDAHFDAPGSGYAGLLAADAFVVDDQLADLLELDPVPPDTFAPRPLDPSRQLGLLTHPAVLAAHSKESGASPFPIGAFVYNNVLCDVIPPPSQVPVFEEESELSSALTLRQRLEQLVQGAECMGCHTLINPPGFAFLPFDPIGRYIPADSQGRVHDTAGTMHVGEDRLMFDDISGLATQLAAHPSTADCVADRLFRWTYGRFERSGDERELAALRVIARELHTDAHAMLEAVVLSDDFIHVRHLPEETSP